MAATSGMTAEEFYAWWCRPENEDRNWELHRGRVVEIPFRGQRHGVVCANVNGVLGRFVHATRCGYLCLNNTGVIVERAPDTVLGPDVAFYTGAKAMEELDWFFATTPPLLAVEVGSADDRFTGMNRRVMWFHKCGVQAVWFVDPDERAITVHQAGATVCVLEEADELSGGEALPGFRCRVAEFFALPGR